MCVDTRVPSLLFELYKGFPCTSSAEAHRVGAHSPCHRGRAKERVGSGSERGQTHVRGSCSHLHGIPCSLLVPVSLLVPAAASARVQAFLWMVFPNFPAAVIFMLPRGTNIQLTPTIFEATLPSQCAVRADIAILFPVTCCRIVTTIVDACVPLRWFSHSLTGMWLENTAPGCKVGVALQRLGVQSFN